MTGAAALRIGTRASALATTQAGTVASSLRALGLAAELVPVSSRGDVDRATSLVRMAGSATGIFTSVLREALLSGEVDVAVHSLKDLPVLDDPDELTLAAVPVREDPADLLVTRDGRTLDDLPHGAGVGTGAPRRAAQLLAARPDLRVVAVRGNIDTRLRRLDDTDEGPGLDAIVLAAAGLNRLGRDVPAVRLEWPVMLPAPGQGALAVEMRADHRLLSTIRAGLDDVQTRHLVCAERAVLARLGAGCTAAVAALAVPADGPRPGGAPATTQTSSSRLRAAVLAADGTQRITAEATGPMEQARRLGSDVGTRLLESGAAELLSAAQTPEQRERAT